MFLASQSALVVHGEIQVAPGATHPSPFRVLHCSFSRRVAKAVKLQVMAVRVARRPAAPAQPNIPEEAPEVL
jgi:hypothetical protein